MRYYVVKAGKRLLEIIYESDDCQKCVNFINDNALTDLFILQRVTGSENDLHS